MGQNIQCCSKDDIIYDNIVNMDHQRDSNLNELDGRIKEALRGSKEAQFWLGYKYDKDGLLDEAESWYLRAARNSHPTAQFNLGILYANKKDYQKAIHWFNESSNGGNINGMFYCGLLELLINNSPSIALDMFIKSGNEGLVQAKAMAGTLMIEHYNNRHLEGMELLEDAASYDNPLALYNLGYIYYHGIPSSGILRDEYKSNMYYTLSKEANHGIPLHSDTNTHLLKYHL